MRLPVTAEEVLRAWNVTTRAFKEIDGKYRTLEEFETIHRPVRAATADECHCFDIIASAGLRRPFEVAAGE